MPKCSNILEFHLFADDTNLFLYSPNIVNLETNFNVELEKVSQWLYAKKLSLNIEKPALWYSILHKEEMPISWILVSPIHLLTLIIKLNI